VWLGELGISRPVLVVAALAGLLLCSLPGLARLQVATDLSALIPAQSEAAQALAMVAESIEGSEAVYGLLEVAPGQSVGEGELERVGERLAGELAGSSRIAASRWRPGDGLPSRDPRAIFAVMDDQALEDVVERFNPDSMPDRAMGLRRMMGGPMDLELGDWLRSDPLLLGEIFGAHVGRGLNRVGGAADGFSSADGRALVIIIDPLEVADDPFHEKLAGELSRISERVMADVDPDGHFRFGLTGSRIQAWQISSASRSEAALLSMVSLVFVLLLYLGFYRSLTSLLLVLGLLPVAVFLTLGWAGFCLVAINPLALGFVAMVFGLGIDPAIHLISRYRADRIELEPVEAARAAIRAVGPAVVLATLTTSSALLLLAVLDPVQGQVGLLAGVAVATNALVMLTGLPALWVLLGARLSPDPGLGIASSRRLAGWLRRNSTAVLALALASCMALAAFSSPPIYEATLRGFQPVGLDSVRVQRALEEHFGEENGELFVLCRGSDQQAVLEANDRWAERLAELRETGRIAGYDSLAAIHPAEATARTRYERLRSRVDLGESLQAFRTALSSVGFAPGAFEDALSSLERPPEQLSLDADWTRWLEQRYMNRVDGELSVLTRVFPSADLLSTAELLELNAPELTTGVSSRITGVELVERDAMLLLEHRLPRLLLLISMGLLIVLALAYRAPTLVLSAFLPLLLSLTVFVLAHCALGSVVTPFTLAGLLLLIGVGVDDHLFMLAHYLSDGGRRSLEETMAGAGRAILVTTITSLSAFSVLAFSQFEPLARFGRSAGLALALAFVASVMVLPALLARFEKNDLESV